MTKSDQQSITQKTINYLSSSSCGCNSVSSSSYATVFKFFWILFLLIIGFLRTVYLCI